MLDFGYASFDQSQPDLEQLMTANPISVDIESSGISIISDVPYGYSLTNNVNSAYFVWMHNGFFADLLTNEDTLKIAHNAKFERSMLKRSNIIANNWCDTIIAAHLIEEKELSLEYLLLGRTNFMHKTYSQYPYPIPMSSLNELVLFFGTHAVGPMILWNEYQRSLRAEGLWNCFWNIEMPIVPVLSDMELTGAYIDKSALASLGEYYDDKISIIQDGLAHYAYKSANVKNINFNSPDQIADLFYNKLKIPKPPPWTYRDKKRPSVDKKYLELYKGKLPIISLYLKFKSYKHMKSTYVNGIIKRLVDSRIHTNFNQTRARTGRLSSSDPNLQNIPIVWAEGKKIRTAFSATPDGNDRVILKADFDQMELRDLACWSGCDPLIEAFNAGRDVHGETAIRVFNDIARRPEAKTLHYQLAYGGGSKEHKEMFFTSYPQVKKWIDTAYNDFEIFGYARTRGGRKRNLGNFEVMAGEEAAHAKREGVSTKIQGSCAEVMKVGMRKVWEEIRDSDIYMILQVHDELVFDLPRKRVPDLVDILQRNLTYNELQIPLTVSISVGDNWGETKAYNPNGGNAK